MKLWWQLSARWLGQHWRLTLAALLIATVTVFAGVGLLGVAGWFLTTAFLAGTMVGFNVFIPSALVRGLSILRIVSRYLERVTGHQVTLGLQSEVRSRSFARIGALRPEQLARFRDGDLVARLVSDIDRLDTFFLLLVTPVGAGAIAGLFFSWVLGQYLPLAAWLVLIGMAVAAVLLPYALARRSGQAGREVQEGFAQMRALAHDSFAAHSDLVVCKAQERFLEEFEQVLAANAQAADRLNAQESLGVLGQQLLMGLLVFLLLVLGGYAHTQAEMSAPMWVGLIFGLMGLFEVLAPVMRGAVELGAVHAASARLQALDTAADVTDHAGLGIPENKAVDAAENMVSGVTENTAAAATKNAATASSKNAAYSATKNTTVGPSTAEADVSLVALPASAQALQVRHLSVQYGQHEVLADVSFSLPAGQRMVIQGLSGAGKSTLLFSLMRIIPYQGQIVYGDYDLATIDEAEHYRHFALLSQHSPVFLGTVRYNLLIGNPEATDEQLWAALRAVHLAPHVEAMGGLDSWSGEGGNSRSTGQGRRLCMARILLSAATVWLLDEPTAGLDAETAQSLWQDVAAVAKGRSVIVVSHAEVPEGFARQRYRLVGGQLLPLSKATA